ncbi:MAG: hypothetical protein VX834_08795, partial [Myxococcota bacterium]|nr:hypothetical protein [Myxococcota bacterium]
MLLGLLGLMIPPGIILAGIWFVQSDTFREEALPQIIATVEAEAGIEIEYGSLRIDPAAGLGFQDVSIRSVQPPMQWSLEAKAMRADYRLDEIFSERIIIEALELSGVRLEVVLPPKADTVQGPVVEAVPLAPNGMVAQLHEALAGIPFQLELQGARLGIDLIEVSTAPGEVPSQSAELGAIDIVAKGLVEPGRVSGELRVQVGQSQDSPSPIHVITSRFSPTQEVQVGLHQVGFMQVDILANPDVFELSFPKLQLDTSMTSLRFHTQDDGVDRSVQASELGQAFSASFAWVHPLSNELPAMSDIPALGVAFLSEMTTSATVAMSAKDLRVKDRSRLDAESDTMRTVEASVETNLRAELRLKDGVVALDLPDGSDAMTLSEALVEDAHQRVQLGSFKVAPHGHIELPVTALREAEPKLLASQVSATLGARLGIEALELAADDSLPLERAKLTTDTVLTAEQAAGKLQAKMISMSQVSTPKLGSAAKDFQVTFEVGAEKTYSALSMTGSLDVHGDRALSAMGTLGVEDGNTVRIDAQSVVHTPVFTHQFPQYAASLAPMGVGNVRNSLAVRLPLRDSIENTFAAGVIETLPVSGSMSAVIEGQSPALTENVGISMGFPLQASGTFSHSQARSTGNFKLSLPEVVTADATLVSPEFEFAPSLSGSVVEAGFSFVIPELKTEKLRRSGALRGQGRLDADLDNLGVRWEAGTSMSGMADTKFQGELVDGPGRFDVTGTLDVRDLDQLIELLPESQPLPANAPSRLVSNYRLGVSHAGTSLRDVTADSVLAGHTELVIEGTLEPREPTQELGDHILGLWPEPLQLDLQVVVSKERATVQAGMKTARLEAVGQGVVHEFEATMEANAPLADPTVASMDLEAAIARLDPDPAVLAAEGLDEHLSDLTYALSVHTLADRTTREVAMRAGSRGNAWTFTAEGQGDQLLEQARFDAVFEAALPVHVKIPEQALDLKGKGRVVAPVEVIVVGAREVVVTGKMHFDGVDAIQPEQAVYGLNGTMELNQSL